MGGIRERRKKGWGPGKWDELGLKKMDGRKGGVERKREREREGDVVAYCRKGKEPIS